MSRNTKILSAIAVAVLLVAIGLIAYVNLTGSKANRYADNEDRVSVGPVAAGKVAADFQLRDLRGRTISLSSLHGKVIFLNVWATWCAPCREEMPSIESLYEEFKNDKDFVVLAVSQDSDGRNAVAPYVQHNNLNFTVLLDPQNEVGEAYNVSGIPESFVIDRDGRIVAHHVGPYDWSAAEIRAALQELLNSKAG
jgi:cytochrome c biogenesis protein CcmG, thiol:disulfide interchange protein DsbE